MVSDFTECTFIRTLCTLFLVEKKSAITFRAHFMPELYSSDKYDTEVNRKVEFYRLPHLRTKSCV